MNDDDDHDIGFDIEFLKHLPLELQEKIIIENLKLSTIVKLCKTDTYFRNLCSNELNWKAKFLRFAEIMQRRPNEVTVAEIFGKTWLEKIKILKILTRANKLVYFISDIELKYIDQDTSILKLEPELIIGYSAKTREEAILCLQNDYNAKVEPVYSKLNEVLLNMIHVLNQGARESPVEAVAINKHIDYIISVLRGEDTFRYKSITGIYGHGYQDQTNLLMKSIIVRQKYLYNFDNTGEITILYNDVHHYVITAISGNNPNDLNVALELEKLNGEEIISSYMRRIELINNKIQNQIPVMSAQYRLQAADATIQYERRILDLINQGLYYTLTGKVRGCSIFSSLVPPRARKPIPASYMGRSVSRLKPPTNMRLPPPHPEPPPPLPEIHLKSPDHIPSIPSLLPNTKLYPPPRSWIKQVPPVKISNV